MNREQFAKYQKELNSCRENELKSSPKLSPKVLLNDEDFEVTIDDIPIEIKLPVLPVPPKPVQKKTHKNLDSKALW
jgi:hypothetical protein